MAPTTHCCVCISLKTGTILIGARGIVYAIAGLIQLLIFLITGMGAHNGNREKSFPEYRGYGNRVYLAVITFALPVAFIQLVFSVGLVYGTVKEKPRNIKIWIYYWSICLIVTDTIQALVIIAFFICDLTPQWIGLLVGAIIYTLIEAYLINVVKSYYRQLKGIMQAEMPARV